MGLEIQHILIGIIIILIITLIYVYRNKNISENFTYEYLNGLWIADEEFCEKATIDGMLIYIANTDDVNVKRASLIMYSNNMVIENKIIILDFKSAKNTDYTNVILDLYVETEDGSKIEKIMPAEQSVSLDVVNGRMSWVNDDITYAVLIKDNLSAS
jgi:hypothetical protein